MQDIKTWILIMVQLPAEPSRHRVAAWRELRRIGAVPAAAGVWAVPDLPSFTDKLGRVDDICHRAGGSLVLVDASPRGADSQAVFQEAFMAARRDEWKEFVDDCGKFEAEIAKEIAKEKFTFGELEEEEQSLERLQRWAKDLTNRDATGMDEGVEALKRLDNCVRVLSVYADMVYERVQTAALGADLSAGAKGETA